MTWPLIGRIDGSPIVQHVFSHRKWQVQIRYGLVKEGSQPASESTIWLTPEEFSDYPFAKPQQKNWTTFTKNKIESGTEIGNSLEFDFVVPPPHS